MEKRLLVIQEHNAKRAGLHWDIRFETDDKVLRSFVIPKHEFPEKGKFRMAILVEDHPWDYKDFDGVIPSGYGEGTVKLLFSDYVKVEEFNENKVKFEFENKWYMIFKTNKNYLIKQI
jgi:DNA ligase D-like protein (predicted 3'-phosphoesterase)